MAVTRLSIIVPVYNVRNYLAKCLDSLLIQDIPYEEYEIIIVNDGSTDESEKIAEKFCVQYSNIYIINQENKGLGAARNAGIQRAQGKYLMFIDSDDYIQKNSLNKLLYMIEKENLDILRFNYEAVTEEGEIIPKKNNAIHHTIYSENIVDGETFIYKYLGWACYVWNYVYDTKFIKSSNINFKDNRYFEDVDWLLKVLLKTRRIRSADIFIYNYLQRSGSITKSITEEKNSKVINDYIGTIKDVLILRNRTNNNKVKQWVNGFISLSVMSMLAYSRKNIPAKKSEIYNFIREEKLRPFKSYFFTMKQKRDLTILNISPKIYYYLKSD